MNPLSNDPAGLAGAAASRPQLPHTALSRGFDALIERVAQIAHWTWAALMLTIVVNVVLRYAFSDGHIELEELQWHLYAIGWLLGLSFCYSHDEHVRVDLLHERLGLKTQAVIELVGILVLLLPFTLLVLWYAVPFVLYSWQMSEISMAPGGLPYRWAIKAVLFVGFALLLLGILSRLSRLLFLLLPCEREAQLPSMEVQHGN